jgi:hypothetical protein
MKCNETSAEQFLRRLLVHSRCIHKRNLLVQLVQWFDADTALFAVCDGRRRHCCLVGAIVACPAERRVMSPSVTLPPPFLYTALIPFAVSAYCLLVH